MPAIVEEWEGLTLDQPGDAEEAEQKNLDDHAPAACAEYAVAPDFLGRHCAAGLCELEYAVDGYEGEEYRCAA